MYRAIIILMALLFAGLAGAEEIPPADFAEPLPIMVVAGTPGEAKPEAEPVPEAETKPETTVYAYVSESSTLARLVLEAGLTKMPAAPWRWSPVGVLRQAGRISEVEAFRRAVEAEARRKRLREARAAKWRE